MCIRDSSNTLLKAELPMSVSNAKAAYDLGIGFIERGNNTATAYEMESRDWSSDVCSSDLGSAAARRYRHCQGYFGRNLDQYRR